MDTLARSARERGGKPMAARAPTLAPLPARRPWTVVALGFTWIVLLTFALYGRTWSFGYTNTDDALLIEDNAVFLASLRNIPAAFRIGLFGSNVAGEGYYRPIVTTTYIADAQWEGANPSAYHGTNVLLHAVASVLLFIVVRTLLMRARPPAKLATDEWLALGATTLFVVHPALTETVAWIPGRCDSLLAIWTFAATIAFLRFAASGRASSLLVHGVFLLLALLTKETAVVLPAFLLGYAVLVDRRSSVLREGRLWIGWTAAVGVWLVLRLTTTHSNSQDTVGERLSVAKNHLSVIFMHLGKVVLPYRLSPLAFATDTPWAPGVVATAGAALIAWRLEARHRRLFVWGLAGFVLFLAPTLLVSDSLILENRLYLPTACVLISLSAAAQHALDVHVDKARSWAAGLAVATAAAAALLTLATMKYINEFRDPTHFTEAAVRQSPHSPLAHLNFGSDLYRNHHISEAEQQYDEAIHLDETQPVGHNNLGLVYMNRGQLDLAEREFRRELEINPRYDKAYYNLGLLQRMMGRTDAARESFQRAIELNPTQVVPPAEPNAPTGEPPRDIPADVVLKLYEEGLRRDPANVAVRRRYAELCQSRGFPCAREQYAIMLRSDPEDTEARRVLGEH